MISGKRQFIYLDTSNIEVLEEVLQSLEKDTQIKHIQFLMADQNAYPPEILQPVLDNLTKNIMGGIFPEIIVDGKRKSEGILLIPGYDEIKTLGFDLNWNNQKIFEHLQNKFGDLSNISGTLIVYCDALGENKNNFLDALFNFFGINVTYLGGGTGSLTFEIFPCIIDNQGIHENAAVIGLLSETKEIGVAHGWDPISKPMKVTETDGNRIISINWRPAFEVYKEIVELHSEQIFTDTNFLEIAKSYPFGVAIMDAEIMIRDPYNVEGTTMLIFDVIHEGEYVSIMHGDIESLLKGAKKAKDLAFRNPGHPDQSVFCVDCITRVLYMGEEFHKELSIIENGSVNGILSLGEIANSGESFLDIFNKTIVVAKW